MRARSTTFWTTPELVAKVYHRGKRPLDLELDGEFTFRPAPANDRRLMTAYAAAVDQDRFERPIWDRGAKGALPKARPPQHPSVDSLRCGLPQRCCRLSAVADSALADCSPCSELPSSLWEATLVAMTELPLLCGQS